MRSQVFRCHLTVNKISKHTARWPLSHEALRDNCGLQIITKKDIFHWRNVFDDVYNGPLIILT